MKDIEGVCLLTADIGGTHSRFEIFKYKEQALTSITSAVYHNHAFHDIDAVMAAFLQESQARHIDAACLAVAGPVQQSHYCRLTNLNWELNTEQLSQRWHIPRVCLLNDIAAIPYGIKYLAKSDLHCLQQGSSVDGDRVVSFLGVGTGLGQSLAIYRHGELTVLSTEAGHADFAPGSALQQQLLSFYRQDSQPISNEFFLSGQGIVHIYQAMGRLGFATERLQWSDERSDLAREISQAAQQGDPLASQAINAFIHILGSYAGNVALQTLPTGGLYLAGGVVPKLLPLMKAETFLQGFHHKAAMQELLATIPVYVILNSGVARLGAADYLLQQLKPNTTTAY
ncbi:MAG: glucokinase [Gammaproteobacteria bacterium]|nr:glucokinase [Gammaproteobacteria bacterium]